LPDRGYFGEEIAQNEKIYLKIALKRVKQLSIWSKIEHEKALPQQTR